MSGAGGIDASSEEWKLACLARHVCRLPTKADRHAFLNLMRKSHKPEFVADIENRVRREWVLMYPPKH